jgi:hypothetical protein
MGRLTDLFVRPSAWLGLVGTLLLGAALVWSIAVRLVPPAAATCPELRASGPSDQLRILDVGSAELELRGQVCLAIDNVIPEAEMAQRDVPLIAARAELAQAEQALAAVQAPRSAPAGAPVWRRSSRTGRMYLAAPASVSVTASPEAVAAARARREAAAAKVVAALKARSGDSGERKLALFLNGERAPVPARTVRGTSRPQTVIFSLQPDERASAESSGYWRRLLGQRNDRGLVPVTIGIAEEGQPLPTATLRTLPARNGGTSRALGFRVYRPEIMWLAGAGIVLMLIGVAGLARSTALLRDGRSRYSRYSLARVQMAWWFALSIAGFVYIWLVTGQYLDVIGSATFVLLGIAGATAGAARVVDGPKTRTEPLSRGFLADIGGGERIELHRLQMIAWTIVLGGIYAWNVLTNFTLTDFDANLLALAGVVNGVYVGLKTQEA